MDEKHLMEEHTEEKHTKKHVEFKPTYMIRPNFQHKFKKSMVKDCIHDVMLETLQEKEYNSEEVVEWTQTISNTVKNQLKEMGFERYKLVVQCVIGEQRGQDVRMACRCFWDSDTDNYTQDVFINNSLFCVTAAYGLFLY